jgi:hypothetical protein
MKRSDPKAANTARMGGAARCGELSIGYILETPERYADFRRFMSRASADEPIPSPVILGEAESWLHNLYVRVIILFLSSEGGGPYVPDDRPNNSEQ